MALKIDYQEVMVRMKMDVDYIAEEAYNKGYEQAKLIWSSNTNEESYQRGLSDGNDIGYKDGVKDGRNEAWEAARKIVEMPDPPYWEVFDEYKDDLFGKITASEAIEKLKAYEEKQKADEDVKRGDILRNKTNGLTYIVTLASDYGYVLLGNDGNCATTCITNTFEKTGKHFDIDKILEEMKK